MWTPSSGFGPENGTKTQSELIGSVRAELLARTELVGAPLRVALTALYDQWLSTLFGEQPGVALMAVGGLGRREPAPHGDLDLVLLHNGKVSRVETIAERLWYPIWDAGVGLDHSVRTPAQAVAVADKDLKATLGMLDARHIAGDRELTAQVREQVTARWQRDAPSRLNELQELARGRWSMRGDASFLLEPDLKDSRGGLRDWVGLRALASAQLLDLTPELNQASAAILDVRGELHRIAGRSADVVRAQDRDALAVALGLPDADAVLRSVNLSARAIAFATDSGWRRVAGAYATESRSWLRKFRPSDNRVAQQRQPLAQDVVAQAGEIVLARDASPSTDPVLQLRVARVAAEHDMVISDHTLRRLARESAPMPVPWPTEARAEFVTMLGTGIACVAAIEALDQHGVMSALIPEWEVVRFRAQHNPVHLYTVDRHLMQTAVHAAEFAAEVNRPDLLLIAAFLHDIGKGHPGDHSVVGAVLTHDIAIRMGYPDREAELLSQLTRHHLLLPDTATRRDLDDPSTIGLVLAALGDSTELLDLLHYLTIADARATGPAAWSDWKAGLVNRLVFSSRRVMHGEPMPPSEPLAPELLGLAQQGQTQLRRDGNQITIVAPDAVGVLSATAGLLAMHSLDVRSADVRTISAMAVNSFITVPTFGRYPDPELLQSELYRVLAGTLNVAETLRAKAARYDVAPSAARVQWVDNQATDATILEVRTRDRLGLLYWITAALESTGVNIRTARISSLGGFVVDAFYLNDSDGAVVGQDRRDEIAASVLAVLDASTA